MTQSNDLHEITARVVSHPLIKRFGELTGDASAIHFDPEVGRKAGYGGPIAHGLLTGSWAMGALALHESSRLPMGAVDAIPSSFSLRLEHVVRVGDTHTVRTPDPRARELESPIHAQSCTTFETLDQHRARTSSGVVGIDYNGLVERAEAPAPWDLETSTVPDPDRIHYAEDLLSAGPRGRCEARSVDASRIADFVQLSGELNPLYFDAAFASRSRFHRCIEPPMLTFCLAFGDFLRDLLRARMPTEGFAGHIGDVWRLWKPIHPGDVVHTRHQPISSRPSSRRPGMAIVRFGVQTVDQNDRVVQDGETIMMIPARPSPTASD